MSGTDPCRFGKSCIYNRWEPRGVSGVFGRSSGHDCAILRPGNTCRFRSGASDFHYAGSNASNKAVGRWAPHSGWWVAGLIGYLGRFIC